MAESVENVRFEATSRRLFERHGDVSAGPAQGRQAEDSSQSGNTHRLSPAGLSRTIYTAADDRMLPGCRPRKVGVLTEQDVEQIVFEDPDEGSRITKGTTALIGSPS